LLLLLLRCCHVTVLLTVSSSNPAALEAVAAAAAAAKLQAGLTLALVVDSGQPEWLLPEWLLPSAVHHTAVQLPPAGAAQKSTGPAAGPAPLQRLQVFLKHFALSGGPVVDPVP
jgi:hypothetical protein